MLTPVYLAIAVAFLFYVALPVVGAFFARSNWRGFRRRLVDARALPVLGASSPGTSPGPRRAAGEVEAIQGLHELWVRSADGASFVIDLRGAWVYVLTSGGKHRSFGGASFDEDSVERLRWTAIPSLSPRARVFASGEARMSEGRLVMGGGGEPPLVILHDGGDDDLIRRAVRSGRHDNEYWNPVTQVSMALGVLAMSGVVSLTMTTRTPVLVEAIVLAAAAAPVLPLLPPGVVGFFMYRTLWRRARYYRARRDVAGLRPEAAAEAAGWGARARGVTLASGACLAAGLAANAWLAIVVLRRLL